MVRVTPEDSIRLSKIIVNVFFNMCISPLFLGRKALNHELSKLFNEMWDMDVNRFAPGKDYAIELQVTNC